MKSSPQPAITPPSEAPGSLDAKTRNSRDAASAPSHHQTPCGAEVFPLTPGSGTFARQEVPAPTPGDGSAPSPAGSRAISSATSAHRSAIVSSRTGPYGKDHKTRTAENAQ